jgi:flagellar M-ring protein FliF
MQALIAGLRGLGMARLAALGAVGVGLLAVLAVLALRGGEQRMALLYGNLDLRDSGQITDQLDRAHIPYQLAEQGARILVPATDVARARLLLAKNGLPTGGSIGYEIFDNTNALTTTDFQQRINETRALEGELARTIAAIQGVRGARVHIVLPHHEPFARQDQEAQASVLLTMVGAARLDREGIQAILNLVAAAIPGLKPQNIAIIDNRGTLLARAGEPLGAVGGQMSAEELRHATELRLDRAVEDMLEPTLGAGHVRAEAAVTMDYSRLHETQENYNPDGQVVRSQQSVSDKSHSQENAPANVSVQNNLPNANAANSANGTGTDHQRREETTNYEISKTVRTLIREQPQIARISLAVMVDGVVEPGKDGKPVWRPRTPQELAQISTLVKSAIGFDAKRGDQVNVESMRFTTPQDLPPPAPAGLFGFPRGDLLHLAETLLIGLVAVIALLLVVRPMVLHITALPEAVEGAEFALAGGASLPGGAPGMPGGAMPALAGPGLAALAGPGSGPGGGPDAIGHAGGSVPLLEDDSMIHLANIEGQLRASSIRRIGALVDRHPEESLTLIRGWMAQENG